MARKFFHQTLASIVILVLGASYVESSPVPSQTPNVIVVNPSAFPSIRIYPTASVERAVPNQPSKTYKVVNVSPPPERRIEHGLLLPIVPNDSILVPGPSVTPLTLTRGALDPRDNPTKTSDVTWATTLIPFVPAAQPKELQNSNLSKKNVHCLDHRAACIIPPPHQPRSVEGIPPILPPHRVTQIEPKLKEKHQNELEERTSRYTRAAPLQSQRWLGSGLHLQGHGLVKRSDDLEQLFCDKRPEFCGDFPYRMSKLKENVEELD